MSRSGPKPDFVSSEQMKQQQGGQRAINHVVTAFPAGVKLARACLAALLTCLAMPAPAAQRDLQKVDAPNPGPVYIDRNSIRRSGATVRFLYILDLPLDVSRPAAGQPWHSNEVEGILDCGAGTYTFISVREYSGAAAGGSSTGGYTEPLSERKAEKIAPGSTTAFVAEYVCRH